jgi:hypothetical protein
VNTFVHFPHLEKNYPCVSGLSGESSVSGVNVVSGFDVEICDVISRHITRNEHV